MDDHDGNELLIQLGVMLVRLIKYSERELESVPDTISAPVPPPDMAPQAPASTPAPQAVPVPAASGVDAPLSAPAWPSAQGMSPEEHRRAVVQEVNRRRDAVQPTDNALYEDFSFDEIAAPSVSTAPPETGPIRIPRPDPIPVAAPEEEVVVDPVPNFPGKPLPIPEDAVTNISGTSGHTPDEQLDSLIEKIPEPSEILDALSEYRIKQRQMMEDLNELIRGILDDLSDDHRQIEDALASREASRTLNDGYAGSVNK